MCINVYGCRVISHTACCVALTQEKPTNNKLKEGVREKKEMSESPCVRLEDQRDPRSTLITRKVHKSITRANVTRTYPKKLRKNRICEIDSTCPRVAYFYQICNDANSEIIFPLPVATLNRIELSRPDSSKTIRVSACQRQV